MFPTRILLATDGSLESARAARVAVVLSEGLDSDLHVLHVGHARPVYIAPEAMIVDAELEERVRGEAEEEARKTLVGEVAKIEEMGGDVARAYVEMGRSDAEIVRVAEEIGAGLIVVGSRGHGPLRRAVMGSVSCSVVRHAHCPVLVVRSGGGERDYLPGRILLALDGSREADVAARAAVEISNVTGSDLHVVYVLRTDPPMPYPNPVMGESWEANFERVRRETREFIDERARRIEAEGGEVRDTHLVFGRPDEEIVKLSEELDAGLVVTGSRGLGGIKRALMGSVSDSVVRHAHCPVLVMREG
jgi:nucleotide-binding universal stress UspA family protein